MPRSCLLWNAASPLFTFSILASLFRNHNTCTHTPVKAKHPTLNAHPVTALNHCILQICTISAAVTVYPVLHVTMSSCYFFCSWRWSRPTKWSIGSNVNGLKSSSKSVRDETWNNLHSFSRNTHLPIIWVNITDVCLCLYFSVNEDYRRQDFGDSSC